MLVPIAKRVIKLAPQSAAYAITRALAARTQRPPVADAEREAMARATRLRYGVQNVAWSWGDGPLVILVHGWSGRAAQMAPLASKIADLGFRSVAIDVTGHGNSPKRHTRWDYFLNDLAAASRDREVYAYVGHSAGGLAMMAARQLRGLRARRYVCICAPSYPFPPIDAIQKRLDPRQEILDAYKEFIARQFETTWDKLQAGSCYANAGSDLLLLYDETDRYIHHSEGDRIRARCPGAELVKTRGYSHQRVLQAPELAHAVGEFLRLANGGAA